ncbi:mandelate racemase/muconate lactonizing enzyme family protein [Diaminobutyricibacter tongyongensis]|uniref:Mandelate racemase/muconate lactonizing enzyme family protein n=1 Tax=Leifsonia tongyongensis TaxID=1268043 RepID=A0A6L9XU03_9MICO|nr:mandelate racemase/muconate lactonizing enzyme family protein [Diaminobutyricibacter tongyongensis]NEN04747.1 mandelate racemase/muconate lactonizing enzyme family protein [Diaminobutyricibacter tongyongensis]
MRIDAVEFFYLAMPEITLEADGSQDALLVRVTADNGVQGWGECEASPLTSIAAFITPRSHGVCQPVAASVLGERIDGPADIARIAAGVSRRSMDLLQAAHTFSGIEMALWDLLGQARSVPVWSLLGYERVHAKTPYASMLFGDTPQQTLERTRDAVARGFRAVKLGWAGFGEVSVESDRDQLQAAREGIGAETVLLIDAGQIWGEDVGQAAARIPALEEAGVVWLEEPFHAEAYSAYSSLGARSGSVGVAGGEGAHNVHMARNLIDHGGVRFVQIDTGRIGGIGPAKAVADYAAARGVTFVNHTFTSHLALSASLQPFAGLAEHRICEYPAGPSELATRITANHLLPDRNGQIHIPDAPGLGMTVELDAVAPYLRAVDIEIDGVSVYSSPEVPIVSVAK